MAGRIDGRTDWGEGKEEEGGIETWGRRPRASPFSLPLSATLNYMFSGEMARTPAGVRRPQSTIHPTTATAPPVVPRSCILHTFNRRAGALQCSREERERPNHAERKTAAGRAAGGDCDCVHVAM